MKKTTRTSSGILQEISSYVPAKNTEAMVSMRGQHAISQAMFLMEMIDQIYDEEESLALRKKFIASIKAGDPSKFEKSVKK